MKNQIRNSQADLPHDDLVVLVNQISLLLAALPVVYIVSNVINQGWSRITIPIIVQPIFFLLPIALGYLGLPKASKIWLSWVMPIQAIAFSIYNKSMGLDLETSHYMGIRFSILASSVIPFLVFRLNEAPLLFLSLIPSFASLVWFDSIHEFFGVGYYQLGLKESGYSLTTMRVMIAFALVVGGSLFLKRLVEKKEALNRQLIAELTEKNNEVVAQLEEIETQNEQISEQKDQLEVQKQAIELHNQDLERKVVEKTRDILEINTELEKQNFQLEQFAFMAAHNLRGPVARIIGLTNLLPNEITSSSFDEKIIELIKSSSIDLDEVIHDLVAIVQIKSQLNVTRRPLKVVDVIHNVLSDFKPELERQPISIVNEIRNDTEFIANETLIHSVVSSLIDNSLRYRNTNRDLQISFQAKEETSVVQLEISDNGVGFDSALLGDKVFKPFSRFDKDRSGKGLGLYLAKLQMESMRGTISISSKQEIGTIVNLGLARTN